MPTPDPWTAFLDWLTTVLVPNWGELVSMFPFFIVIGLVGPILTLVALMWVWYLLHRQRGHVRRAEAQARPALAGPDGQPVFPPNAPFCEEHALIYPPRADECQIDGAILSVRCPVDDTVRTAALQTCPACGTRFVLGASASPIPVVSSGGPPEGGAAVA